MITDRRNLLGALAASGAAIGASTLAAAAPANLDLSSLKKDTDVACLYHCDFGDPQRFGQMLTNMNNHLSVYEFDTLKVKLVLVAHGAGIKFFLSDRAGTPWEKDVLDEDLYKRVVGLSKFGVEVYLCQITFKRNNIDFERAKTEPFIKFVPSGVATVAELQGKGFAYLKSG
jgi:intracellular sulfur oxidation DsrE/DsrF family protein